MRTLAKDVFINTAMIFVFRIATGKLFCNGICIVSWIRRTNHDKENKRASFSILNRLTVPEQS